MAEHESEASLNDEERTLLAQTVTRLYERRGDPRHPALSRAEVWTELTALGLLGIVVPGPCDGGGGGLVDAGLVCELRGRACDFGGYADTVAAAFALAAAYPEPDDDLAALLRGVAREGWQLVLLDASEPGGEWVGSVVPVAAVRTLGLWHTGTGADEPAVRWGVLDPSAGRPVSSTARHDEREVRLNAATSWSAAVTGGDTRGTWLRARMALEGLRYAEVVGACRWLQQDARRYALERVQFGRPIARFQAVQHQLVDMLAWVDAGELLVRYALAQIQAGDGGPELARAGAFVRDRAWSCLFGSYTVLGGMGFIEEMPVNRYARGVLDVLSRLGPLREVERRSAAFVTRGAWLAQRG